MTLLDLATDDVDGHLRQRLIFRRRSRQRDCWRRACQRPYHRAVEDRKSPTRLPTPQGEFNSTNTWALDDLTGEPLRPFRRRPVPVYGRGSYLRERLDQLLKPQLVDVPLTVDEQGPTQRNRMGDQRLPVALSPRAGGTKHTDKMDTALRQSNLGLTIVRLTTSGLSRRFLRPGIVVSLDIGTGRQWARFRLTIPGRRRTRRRQAPQQIVMCVPAFDQDDAAVLVGP